MSVLDRLWNRSDPVPAPDLRTVEGDPLDSVLEVLANSRRRAVILLLDEGPQELGTLAEEIASLEFGPDFDSPERKAVYVGLWQAHLPVLADHGIVARDGAEGRWRVNVTPGPNHAQALEALAAVQEVVADDGGVFPDG